MSNESAPRRAPQLAAMFQKAYAQAVMLQSADEQINSMLEQREKLEAEIREIQGQINEEFEQVLLAAKRARQQLYAQVSQHPKPTVELPRMKFAPGAIAKPQVVVAS